MKTKKDNFIMLPTNDFCFKGLMRNDKVRKGFIAAILKQKPEDIEETTILPSETNKNSEKEKLGILDVKVKLQNGTMIDMEMQVESLAYWDKRILFYLSKMYFDQAKKGETYDKIQKCIHVSILDFIHFPDDDKCYRIINLCDIDSGKVYTDLFELHILELKKLKNNPQEGDDIIQWMKFFSGTCREEFEMLAELNEYLDEAYRELMELSADDMTREEYEAREKALRDHYSILKRAVDTGLEQGMAQGMAQGMDQGMAQGMEDGIALTKNVLKLYTEQKTPEEIASLCQISLEQVNKILA